MKVLSEKQLDKIKMEFFNKGFDSGLINCIKIIDDSLFQSGCPNSYDGLPAQFIFGEMLVNCYGDKDQKITRDDMYEICNKIHKARIRQENEH